MTTYPNWFAMSAQANFETLIPDLFPETRAIKALQIGAYTGDASVWMLDHLLGHPGSSLTDVDTWEGSDEDAHHSLDWNDVFSVYEQRTTKYPQRRFFRMTSDDFFSRYTDESYDLIYIDGSHTREQVYKDAVNAQKILAPGGVLIFDDYIWYGHAAGHNPCDAIDQFLSENSGEYTVVAKNVQVWLVKTAARPARIAVYAIALDEEANIDGWYHSAIDADYMLIADTGSTDKTVQRSKELAIASASIVVSPWRFDDARNAALALLPKDIDICVNLDLDERLQEGWYDALQKAWEQGINRPTYRYVWNWTDEGAPGYVFYRDHVHARHGYRWVGPVHEHLIATGITEVKQPIEGMVVHQHGDTSKDRSQYLQLLIKAVAEDPTNDRYMHYLGREWMNVGNYEQAVICFKTHLMMPSAVWEPERATSMRFIAKSVAAVLGDTAEVEQWLLRACGEAPGYREPWVALARYYVRTGQRDAAVGAARRGLSITDRELSYITEPDAWDGSLEAIAEGSGS